LDKLSKFLTCYILIVDEGSSDKVLALPPFQGQEFALGSGGAYKCQVNAVAAR
jgi:hypothetical protein